jgi:hypothetical protein
MNSATSAEDVVYCVDELDRIRWVNDAWDRFATANDSPEVASSAVVGTVLWRHVSDRTLQHLLGKLFERARAARREQVLTCRCDAPHVRREIRVRLESVDGKSLVVSSAVLSESHREVKLASPSPDTLLRVCSWCNAVDVRGRWVELEVAAQELHLLDGPYYPAITHGLCDSCAESLASAASERGPVA